MHKVLIGGMVYGPSSKPMVILRYAASVKWFPSQLTYCEGSSQTLTDIRNIVLLKGLNTFDIWRQEAYWSSKAIGYLKNMCLRQTDWFGGSTIKKMDLHLFWDSQLKKLEVERIFPPFLYENSHLSVPWISFLAILLPLFLRRECR